MDGEVDFILIDHSPSVDSSVKIALSAATHIVINADASSYSEEGIHNLLRGEQMKVVRTINPEMKVLGVLFTMVHERSVVGRAVVSEKTCAGYPVLPIYIPYRIEMTENTHFQRFCVQNKLSKLAPYFRDLATYIIEQTSTDSDTEQDVA
jgi:cellulose biosynthesis protein BcsQ